MSQLQSNLKVPSTANISEVSNEKHELTKSIDFNVKVNHVTFQRSYKAVYLGYAVLDRRYTVPMLPWLVAEIKRHGSQNEEQIFLEVTDKSLKAVSLVNNAVVFEHKLQSISKFAQSSQDPCCFTYMTREESSGPSAYHVFQAADENMALELFASVREVSKEMLSNQSLIPSIKQTAYNSVMNSCQQYEVLYLGRIKAPGKRAPPSFIDDAVEKFRLFEIEKARNLQDGCKRRRHGSGASISSLPHNLDVLKISNENGLKKQMIQSCKEDQSSSSGVSSSESINHRSIDAISQVNCDTENVFHSSQNSLSSPEDVYKFPAPSQSLVSHSQSMDFAPSSQKTTDSNHSDSKCSLMPPTSLITHTQSLDASGCVEIVQDFRDIDSNMEIRDRVRSCSGDVPRIKQTSLPIYHLKVENGTPTVGQRPRAYTSPYPTSSRLNNRTMLFLIGQMEICLIGTDKKQMLMSKKFNDIAHCSQGIRHLDHFGFICRETTVSGVECYAGYIFQCQTEKVVDEMMQNLMLAFNKAHQDYRKSSEKTAVAPKDFICESCPMHWFHKLCSEVEGIPSEDAHLIILKRLGCLSDKDKEEVVVKFQNNINNNVQEKNETLMMLLREYAEQKQISHSHSSRKIGNDTSLLKAKEKGSRLGSFRERAKKSLTGSFETFLKLTARDDMKEPVVEVLNPCRLDNVKIAKEFESRSYREGSCDNIRHPTPVSSRPRSSTFTSSRESHLENKKHSRQEVLHSKTPIMNRMTKVGYHNSLSPMETESKGSWRHAIFHRVQTPLQNQKQDSSDEGFDQYLDENEPKSKTKKTQDELRALWKKAIIEQILLIRMEKENKKLQVNQDAACSKRMKLNYEEITPCLNSTVHEWDEILSDTKGNVEKVDKSKIAEMIKNGVPRHKRGEIWQFLAENNKTFSTRSQQHIEPYLPYDELLKQLTSHQHSILIDIGRTFPNHPFYSQSLGSGQLSLFNLLKAYSLLDKEVGYCQGLSFVAGILLLHMPEEAAFTMMKFLMFDLGLRRQYKTDMVAFQIQMYQLSRLIHDNYKDLYDHLEKYDIAPTLYAAPWFLTLFASQFPVGFVSRLFDLIFLFGMDVVFKISLVLLGSYKDSILSCDSFESAMNFLKGSLPSIDVLQMNIIFTQVFNLDISRQLNAYEVEYHVLMEETAHSPGKNCEELDNLRAANKTLRSQNMELAEQLQVAYSRINYLEASDASLKSTICRLEERVITLEDEKEALEYSMKILKKRLERLEFARFEGATLEKLEEDHPPSFGVIYAIAGSEKEEEKQFKSFMRDNYHSIDVKEPKIRYTKVIEDNIAEENSLDEQCFED